MQMNRQEKRTELILQVKEIKQIKEKLELVIEMLNQEKKGLLEEQDVFDKDIVRQTYRIKECDKNIQNLIIQMEESADD